MKDNAEYQENIKAVIEFLQFFHDSLAVAGEPKALCSYCGEAFETIALVKLHVPACKQNPLVAEVERLQPALRNLYNDCRNEPCDEQRGKVMDEARKALEAHNE